MKGENILKYNEETRETKIILKSKEARYLRHRSCENPFCDCGDIDLFAFEMKHLKNIGKWNKFQLNVKEKTVEVTDKYIMSDLLRKETMEIQEELVKTLTREDWEQLEDMYIFNKEKLIEDIEYDDEYLEDFEFDYNQIENPSMLISFNEIYPRGEKLKLNNDGKEYEIKEYYCKNPECDCTNVEFELKEVEAENTVNFRYDYKNKKLYNNDYEWAIKNLRDNYEDIDLRIELRSKRIKLLYTKKTLSRLLEKVESRKMIPIKSEKIGRNEKCPCGSGKKYKKCCMN